MPVSSSAATPPTVPAGRSTRPSSAPAVGVVLRSQAAPRSRWQEEDLLLDVRSEAQQVHELRDTRRGELRQLGELGLALDRALSSSSWNGARGPRAEPRVGCGHVAAWSSRGADTARPALITIARAPTIRNDQPHAHVRWTTLRVRSKVILGSS
jgi:hypothetical protein